MRHHQAKSNSSFIPPLQTSTPSPQAQTNSTAYLPLTPEQQAQFEANTRRSQARVHQAYVDMQAQRAEGQATTAESEEQAQSYVRHPYWQAMYDEQEAKQAQPVALASSAPFWQAMGPETEEDPDLQARAAAAGRHPYWQAAHEAEEARQAKAAQAKENWQQPADPHNIFGNPSPLPSGVMAQYEHLMPGVQLGKVQLHQGAEVDAALQGAGLHGLTDGTNVAVSSKAPADTLPHELGHVAQRQEAGFSLSEGSRAGYEKDADNLAARLMANRPVERFESTVQGKCDKCEESGTVQGKAVEKAADQAIVSEEARGQEGFKERNGNEGGSPAGERIAYVIIPLPPGEVGFTKKNYHQWRDKLQYLPGKTQEFMDHYFEKNGRLLDLSQLGLLDTFKNAESVRDARAVLATFAHDKARDATRTMLSQCVPSMSITGSSTAYPNVVFEIFSVANTTLNMHYSIALTAKKDPGVPSYLGHYANITYKGKLTFSLKDEFSDVVDTFNMIKGQENDIELPGGVPYPITAGWTEDLPPFTFWEKDFKCRGNWETRD